MKVDKTREAKKAEVRKTSIDYWEKKSVPEKTIFFLSRKTYKKYGVSIETIRDKQGIA